MKTASKILRLTAAVAALATVPSGRAGLYNFSANGGGSYTASASSLGQAIPDNSPSGVAYALNFADTGLHIGDISVKLNISGGWNGDLYAYLSHGNGFSVLLNRVGAVSSGDDGYSTSGFDILLQPLVTHSGLTDIHNVTSMATGGSYQADGRMVYTDTSRPQTLDNFVTTDPNGAWTLVFADMAGGNISTLNSWSLEITAVPEPVKAALVSFGVVFAGVIAVRWRLNRKAGRPSLHHRKSLPQNPGNLPRAFECLGHRGHTRMD